jgi:hypothetical protein
VVLTREWIINKMNDNITGLELSDEAVLTFEVSDEMLEASANATTNAIAAMSVASAPTAVILILCCSNG